MGDLIDSPRVEEHHEDWRLDSLRAEFGRGLSWRSAVDREVQGVLRNGFFRLAVCGLGFYFGQTLRTMDGRETVGWVLLLTVIGSALADLVGLGRRLNLVNRAYAEVTGRMVRPWSLGVMAQAVILNLAVIALAYVVWTLWVKPFPSVWSSF